MKQINFIFLLSIIGIFACNTQQTQTLQIIAGSGLAGFKDGNPADLNKPIRLASYLGDSVVFADINNHAIRIASFDGTVITIAGGPDKKGYQDGPVSEAKFNSPHGVAYDNKNDIIYVAEAGNHAIRTISKNEQGQFIVATIAGIPEKAGYVDGCADSALFISPHAVITANNGELFVADIGNACIRKIKDGMVSTVAKKFDGIPEFDSFKYVMDIVFDGENIFIADAGNNAIFKINNTNEVSLIALNDTLSTPHGIAIDKDKNLYVADMATHRLLKIDNQGKVISIAGTGKDGKLVNELNKPAAVLVHNKYLWVADLNNHQIKALQIN